MRQLRIIYYYGDDPDGNPITRRQTLTVLDDATDESLNNFLNQLSNCVDPQIQEAYRIDYAQLM